MRLYGKVSASVDVVSEVPRVGSWSRCYIYCIPPSSSALLGTILWAYAIIPKPLSRRQVMESLNQDLAAINSWCLKLSHEAQP